MPAEAQTIVSWIKEGGWISVCVLLVLTLKWAIQELLREKDRTKDKIETELAAAKAARDQAREQLLAEKDKTNERYHRLASEVASVTKETGAWFEYISKLLTKDRGGGNRPPPPSTRNRTRNEEDEGGS